MSLEPGREKDPMENTEPADIEETAPAADDPYAAFADPTVHTVTKTTAGSKRKKIILFSLLGMFILLAALILLLIFMPQQEDEEEGPLPESIIITLLDKKMEDSTAIKSATLKNQAGTVEIVNNDGILALKAYSELPVNSPNMKALSDVLTTIRVVQDIGEITDLKAFGFDKPSIAGHITYTDDTVYRFELGAPTPDGIGYYFRQADTMHVYVLSASDSAALLQEPLAYISTTVLSATVPGNAESNAEMVLRNMTLGGTSRKGQEFSFRLVTSEDNDSYLYYTYLITEPYMKGADSDISAKLEKFSALEAVSVVTVYPDAGKLKEYGLDDPSTVAEFTLALRTTVSGETDTDGNAAATTTYSHLEDHTLRLGNMVNGYYYCMIDDVPIVYLVQASDIPFADLQYDTFAGALLFLENIDNIGSFKVILPDKQTDFKLAHDPENNNTATNLKVTAGGKTFDTMNFRYLIQNFMNVGREGAFTQSTDDLPLQLTFSYSLLNKTEPALTVRFYEVSPNLSAVVLSNGEKYLVKASAVHNLIQQYQNLLDGKTVLY